MTIILYSILQVWFKLSSGTFSFLVSLLSVTKLFFSNYHYF